MPTRFADKNLLRKINNEAVRRSYNRALDKKAVENLDEDLIVAITPMLVHEHAQGRPVDPHLRCAVAIVHPVPAPWGGLMLDVPFELFELLPKKQEPAKTPA